MAADTLYTLAYARNGGAVRRYHTHSTLLPETVAAHSHGVAMLCYLLSDRKPSANLLMAALAHDLAEGVLGDIPSPVKRSGTIRNQLKTLEDMEDERAGLLFPLTATEKATLKLADAFDGMLYCLTERSMGNQRLGDIFRTYDGYIRALDPDGEALRIYGFILELWRSYESK